MPHRIRAWPWLVVMIAWLGACSDQAAPNRQTANSWRSDETEIRAGIQSSEDAWNRGDLKGHLASYDPSVSVMTKDGPRPGVEGIEKAFAGKYFRDGKPKQQLRLDEVEVRALDDDAALATGRFVLSGGGEPEQSGRFTTVWVRKPEGWRTVHDHSS